MIHPTPFAELADALGAEIALLERLREIAAAAVGPLVALDIPAVEDWARQQAALLKRIEVASSARADLQEACLHRRSRGLAGTGGLATTVTLHALIVRAPLELQPRLRQQRDTLRQLRDEIAAASLRNEVLIGQVLEFTDHLGQGLAEGTRADGYDARGAQADHRTRGELFSGAL